MSKPEIRPTEDGGFEIVADQNLVIAYYQCPGDGTLNSSHKLHQGAPKDNVPNTIPCFVHPGIDASLFDTKPNGFQGAFVT